MTPQIATVSAATGTWTVDSTASQIRFEVGNMWGLATVKGTFDRFRGRLAIGPDSIDTQFSIDAGSLDTGNARRDTHLRSADFFDVERYPEIGFDASDVTPSESGLTLTGYLLIRDSRIRISLPVEIYDNADSLLVRTTTAVSREAAGLGWNRVGMIRGDAALHVELTLVREG